MTHRWPTHRWPWGPVALLSLLVLLPNLVLLVRARDTAFAATVLAQALVSWALLVAAAGRWRWLCWGSLPLLLLVPIESIFIHQFGYPTSRHVVALLGETSVGESLQYLSGLGLVLGAGLAVLLTLWALLARRVADRRLVSRRVQFGALGAVCLFVPGLEALRHLPDSPLAVRQFTLANAYPAGVAYRLAGYWRAEQANARAASAVAAFKWNASTSLEAIDVVFVIGESARPDHWGLAGYARDTTPRLAARGDVHFMPNLVTPWTLTRYSVPTMLKRKRATDGAVLAEKSILAAFDEAGFETHWFANQDGLDEIVMHVGEAQFKRSYNLAVGRGDIDAAFDGDMLPDIRAALARPARRKLLVIHTKGSHWDYDLRYPVEFARFLPDRTPAGDSGKYDRNLRDMLVNAYDNSIRYTDQFLDEIIETLARIGRPAVLVYVSDHGQGLYDGDCSMFGHGNDLEVAFRTAGLVWVSAPWRQAHPGAYDALVRNTGRPLSTAGTVFHTVADFGGLNIADRSASLLNPTMTPQRRWVNTRAGPLDFDLAGRAPVCREVVPASPG